MPLRIQDYIASFPLTFPFLDLAIEPWTPTNDLSHFVEGFTASVDLSSFEKAAGILVHKDATIERGAIIKPPAVISAACSHWSESFDRELHYPTRIDLAGPPDASGSEFAAHLQPSR